MERGDSRRHLPWNLGQFGSNTSFTMTRTNYVAALDAVEKLKEIAALDLGGSPEDYDIGEERVFQRADPSRHLTYAQAASRAIELGGKYSGEIPPEGINEMTARSVAGLAGTGLIGVARDTLPKDGMFASNSMDSYQGMFDQQLALDLSRKGGMGLAGLIERQLSAGFRED